MTSVRSKRCEAGRQLLTASPPLGVCISSLYETALNFAIYGRARPGKTAVRTAVPCILLTRKRSQVQTLSRPPLSSQVTASWAPRPSRSPPGWAALGPRPSRTIDPRGSFQARPLAIRLHNDHAGWSCSGPRCHQARARTAALGPVLPCLAQPAATGDPHAGQASPGRSAVERDRSLGPGLTRPGPRSPLPHRPPHHLPTVPLQADSAPDQAARDTADHRQLDPSRL